MRFTNAHENQLKNRPKIVYSVKMSAQCARAPALA